MKRLDRIVARLTPKRWPVRWRLAAVSAALTLVILVAFALVVGRLTANRLRGDFHDDVRGTAVTIASQAQVRVDPLTGGRTVHLNSSQVQGMAVAPHSALRIVHRNGDPVRNGSTVGAPDLGPPDVGSVREVGDFAVAAYPLPATIQSSDPLYVEFARSTESLDATINRLWLFLGLGVLGGTVLAALAGIAIAGRAMRPVSTLTATAREIASTRDPSRRMPEPTTDDEVAELARTLDQMLRQLDAARSETEQMMQLQREFVADASHELRTPLTSILANLELLQERLIAGAPAEENDIVGSALRSSRRMSSLVSDLLLLARADAGRTGARRECDLAEIASAALAEVRPVADGQRLGIVDHGPVSVNGNPDELHRLALNLLDNGLRHTPAGTSIEVEVERRNGDAVLEVRDDGPGIPPGMEEQVFSRFVRGAGPADVSSEAGTGLGLAIVKAVATSHGGDVEAGASFEGGARFTVRLPPANF